MKLHRIPKKPYKTPSKAMDYREYEEVITRYGGRRRKSSRALTNAKIAGHRRHGPDQTTLAIQYNEPNGDLIIIEIPLTDDQIRQLATTGETGFFNP